MANRLEISASRQIACSGCGAAFTCNPSGPCWCSDESFRLPLPSEGGECLCPDCLRKMAGEMSAGRADRTRQV